jgi:DMSO/TMAO reductase YedYZ molybdopterin-dependent catalytic subunit
MSGQDIFTAAISRRHLLAGATAGGIALASHPGLAGALINLPLSGRPTERPITTAFPQKGAMILQRTRPPLLETPFEVFDRGVFTPNNQFFVRWHWALIPSEIDADSFRLAVRGQVDKPLSLSLKDIASLPRFEIAAVNQCSGNSRGFVTPPVTGAQWANGAMGNALWTGVRLKDILDKAGIKSGAIQVRFKGLDQPLVPDAPTLMKSLTIDHARNGEVMIAYAMNGEQLPLLNGFPLRLVVPGWFSTYWVKMLSDIEVLAKPDDSYWMAKAYTIPDTPRADMKPGQNGVKMVPISRMVPRSFITNLKPGARLAAASSTLIRGIAFGGDAGVAKVELSLDGGKHWNATQLGKDEGKFGFRLWSTQVSLAIRGAHALMVRCTNSGGEAQPMVPNWNPGGFMHNAVETTSVIAN